MEASATENGAAERPTGHRAAPSRTSLAPESAGQRLRTHTDCHTHDGTPHIMSQRGLEEMKNEKLEHTKETFS